MHAADGNTEARRSSSRACRSDVGPSIDTRLRVDPKVTLHPASFEGTPSDDGQSGTSPEAGPSSGSGSSPPRIPVRRRTFRDTLDDGTNPFALDRREVREGHPAFRRELYPGYDETGRHIGLDHLRGPGPPPQPVGHYRQHVHEYDAARGHQLPIPAQQTMNAGEVRRTSVPHEGPVFPASKEPCKEPAKTPHELLGIPPHLPLNLSSLRDPPPGKRPQYHHHILAKLAILSSPSQRATLQEILAKIKERFSFYRDNSPAATKSFEDNVRHLLSLHQAFIRKPKPATEPGKGAYWTLDLTLDGLKRVRKRNTKSKKSASNANEKGKKKGKRNASTSLDSRQPAHWAGSDAEETEDDDEAALERELTVPLVVQVQASPVQKAARRSRPIRPVVNTSSEVARNAVQRLVTEEGPVHGFGPDLYNHIDPALMEENMQGIHTAYSPQNGSVQNHGQLPVVSCQYVRTGSIGAHRERISRGVVRTSPYPVTKTKGNEAAPTSSGTDQSSSPIDTFVNSPMDGRGRGSSESPASTNAPLLHPFPQPEPFHTGGGYLDPVDRRSITPHLSVERRYYSSESPSPPTEQTSLPTFPGHRMIHASSPLAYQPSLPPPSAPDASYLPSGPYFNSGPHFGAPSFPSPDFSLSGGAANSNMDLSQLGFASSASLFADAPQTGSVSGALPPFETLVRRDDPDVMESRATSEPFTGRQLRSRTQHQSGPH